MNDVMILSVATCVLTDGYAGRLRVEVKLSAGAKDIRVPSHFRIDSRDYVNGVFTLSTLSELTSADRICWDTIPVEDVAADVLRSLCAANDLPVTTYHKQIQRESLHTGLAQRIRARAVTILRDQHRYTYPQIASMLGYADRSGAYRAYCRDKDEAAASL